MPRPADARRIARAIRRRSRRAWTVLRDGESALTSDGPEPTTSAPPNPYADALEAADVFAWWAERGLDPLSLEALAPALSFAPPGHFYSPVPDPEQVEQRLVASELPGIDLDLEACLGAIDDAARHLPLPAQRWNAGNDQFGPTDALVLTSIARDRSPRRWIEIGSGHSTAALLDALDHVDVPSQPRIITVDPFADRLRTVLADGDADRIELIEEPVQALSLSFFDQLEAGDVLFLDTTHVVNPGSDVVYELLEILPRLARGVLVHVHDIIYPFDVPEPWLQEGRIWNEPYLLRALLTDSSRYRIVQWADALARLRRDELLAKLPEGTVDTGTSLWLEVMSPPSAPWTPTAD